ncbi:SMI1/KNR4 family protein [Salinibius halmophilus]|uniref:SMI1/KNR4 family protein n=1 Tax=Salinibius halmophilus TaxID=1853216 RepID=UPI000E66541A|nr:SMI1/KNR4 family protein [Salinibius halmophilus]
MDKLAKLLEMNGADTLPATAEQVEAAEQKLGLCFAPCYKEYLRRFGVISVGANETYGLGVKESSFLNIVNALSEFKKKAGFPANLIPLSSIGDGHYYMFDNDAQKVVVLTLPDLGTRDFANNLELFLIDLLLA